MTMPSTLLRSPEMLAQIRTGDPELATRLAALSGIPAPAWREAVREAIVARQPASLATVLAHAPPDWATAQRSAQNWAFHGIFQVLAPIKDGTVTAELALILLPHLPASLTGGLLFSLDTAPEVLARLWPHLPDSERWNNSHLRAWYRKPAQVPLLERCLALSETPSIPVDRVLYWVLQKPTRLTDPGWPVLMRHWVPGAGVTPADLVEVLQKTNVDQEPLLATLCRVRDLGLRLDAHGNVPEGKALRQAWQRNQVDTAAVLIALTPPQATLHELIAELYYNRGEAIDASLVSAQGQPDPHGHLEYIATHLDTTLVPQWRAVRHALARHAQLEQRPPAVAPRARPRA